MAGPTSSAASKLESAASAEKNAADGVKEGGKVLQEGGKELQAGAKALISALQGGGIKGSVGRLGEAFGKIDTASTSGGSGKEGTGSAGGGFAKLTESLLGSSKNKVLSSGSSIGGVKLGGMEGIGGKSGGFAQMASGVATMASAPLTNKTAPGAIGSAVGGAGDTIMGAGMATGNPYAMAAGVAVGATLKFAGALIQSVDKLRDFSKSLFDADTKFAEFSGSMTAVKEIKEVRDMMREMGQGERRAGATSQLAEAMSDFEDFMAPIEDDLAIIKDLLVSHVLPLAKGLIQFAMPVFQPWLDLLKKILGSTGETSEGEFTTVANYALEEATKELNKQIRDTRPRNFR